MGTNYYWKKSPPCASCGHEIEPKHIGKSSGGWCFSMHVYPDEKINTLEQWHSSYSSTGEIKDEYGDKITPEEMLLIMTARSRNTPVDEFVAHQNGAINGPNNLLRHKIGRFCIGHHEKYPVDYMVGEFS